MNEVILPSIEEVSISVDEHGNLYIEQNDFNGGAKSIVSIPHFYAPIFVNSLNKVIANHQNALHFAKFPKNQKKEGA
jgi:tyrosine-protein phosphatase YwqE